MNKERYVIAVDFDGTCVTHDFPYVGMEIGAVKPLRALAENGHKLILFTMRDHNELHNSWNSDGQDTLKDAVNWFEKNEIPLYGVNVNPNQYWSTSRKVYANLYIDDAALGIPLKTDKRISSRPFVDWNKVSYMLYDMGLITAKQLETISIEK